MFPLEFESNTLDVFFQLKFLWNEVCDEILTEANQQCVTPKLITKLMYAFRDIQVRISFAR